MPFLLLLLGIGGGAFAWGWSRQRSASKTTLLAPTSQAVPFPWEPTTTLTPLDSNLEPDVARAVRFAAHKEASPISLIRFANSLAPDYPLANTLLLDVAKRINEREQQKNTGETLRVAISGFEEADRRWSTFFVPQGLLGLPNRPDLGLPFYDQAGWEKAIATGRDAYDRPLENAFELRSILEKNVLHDKYVKAAYGAKIRDGRTIMKALEDVHRAEEDRRNKELEGCGGFFGCLFSFLGDVFGAMTKYFFLGTKILAPILANIPVVGTAIAAVSTFAASMALGERIDQALLDSARAALPGQPASGMAFDAARKMITGMAAGDSWDSILLNGARDALIREVASKLPPIIKVEDGVARYVPHEVRDVGSKVMAAIPAEVQQAIDVSLSLAQSAKLQEAGFEFFRNLAKGDDATEKAASFMEAMRRAEKGEGKLEDILIKDVRDRLYADVQPTVLAKDPTLTAAEVRKRLVPVLEALQFDPQYPRRFNMRPDELAQELGISPTLAYAALATTRYLPIEKWMRRKLEEDGLLSPEDKFPFVEWYIAHELMQPPPLPPSISALTSARMANVLATERAILMRDARRIAEREAQKPPLLRTGVLVDPKTGTVRSADMALARMSEAMIQTIEGRKQRERALWTKHYNEREAREGST